MSGTAISIPGDFPIARYIKGDRYKVKFDRLVVPKFWRDRAIVRSCLRDHYQIGFFAFESLGGSIGGTQRLRDAVFTTYIGRYTLNVKCTMSTADLLKIVQENKLQHAIMLKEAVEGFCEKASQACQAAIVSLQNGKANVVSIRMAPPEDHSKDYARAIKMLDMTTEDYIELDEHDFATLVNDDWDWIPGWVNQNRGFSKTCASYGTSKGL